MLQAHGLCSKLVQLGFDAEIIDYRQRGLENYFKFKFTFPPRLRHYQRLRRAKSFVHGRQRLSAKSYDRVEDFAPDANRYDVLICGSDQVWFTGPVQYYDPMYFLDIPGFMGRKISYAASVGGTSDFGEFREKAGAALRDIDFLAVRDPSSAAVVRSAADVDLTQVVDPVFLHHFEDCLEGPPPPGEPYLLVFGNFGEAHAEAIRRLARQKGLKRIVSLQYPCPAATERIAAPGPEQWLRYFRNATCVLTSYFHGVVVSIKFGRDFVTVPTSGRRTKVKGMLGDAGCPERYCESIENADDLARVASVPLDWSVINARIAEHVEKSNCFLTRALEAIPKPLS